MVVYVLQVLTLVASLVAFITEVVVMIFLLHKSILAKRSSISLSTDDFNVYTEVYPMTKILVSCGFIFQFFGWMMFSTGQDGFMDHLKLNYFLAICFAVLCLFVLVLGIISLALNHSREGTSLIRKKIEWYMFHSILYFCMVFILGG